MSVDWDKTINEILAGTLGYTNEKIEALVEDGVVGRGNQRG